MAWWKQGTYPLKQGKSNFLKIIDFYLFCCPVEKNNKSVSVRGKTFRQRDIQKDKFSSLLKDMKKSLEYCEFLDPQQNVEQYVTNIIKTKNYKNKEFQIVVLHRNKKLSQAATIFDGIRNAFAHGAFSVKEVKKEKIYYLENCYKETIKAQFRIKESTLLSWIDLVEKYTI